MSLDPQTASVCMNSCDLKYVALSVLMCPKYRGLRRRCRAIPRCLLMLLNGPPGVIVGEAYDIFNITLSEYALSFSSYRRDIRHDPRLLCFVVSPVV